MGCMLFIIALQNHHMSMFCLWVFVSAFKKKKKRYK